MVKRDAFLLSRVAWAVERRFPAQAGFIVSVQFFKISFEAPVLLLSDILCCVERLFCVIDIRKAIKRYTVD